MRSQIIFYLNGQKHSVGAEKASMMLADYLRYDQALTGTKVVCAEGDCGACSVLRFFPHSKGIDSDNYIPINSCITPVATLDSSSLITVEALQKNEQLHEAQRSMVDCHGSQCGFCTPGFVIALAGLVEEKISKKQNGINEKEAKNCLTGNLCRCTGYKPIVEAAISIDIKKESSLKARYFNNDQDQDLKNIFSQAVLIDTPDFSFFAPKTLSEATAYLAKNPETQIIASSTDLGVVHNKRKTKLVKLMSLHLIEELYHISGSEKVRFGARVTLTEFRHFIKDLVPEIADYLDVFASPQIKNIATVAGNIANASPIGDMPPVFLALDANVIIHGAQGKRSLPLHEFFLDYRKTALKQGEIISAIEFDRPSKTSNFRAIKNSNRKDLDISAVNLVMKIDWQDDKKTIIRDVRLAAGGIAATPIRLKKTEDFLRSKTIDAAVLNKAAEGMHQEFSPLSDLRASSAYRHVLMENHFMRFFSSFSTGAKS